MDYSFAVGKFVYRRSMMFDKRICVNVMMFQRTHFSLKTFLLANDVSLHRDLGKEVCQVKKAKHLKKAGLLCCCCPSGGQYFARWPMKHKKHVAIGGKKKKCSPLAQPTHIPTRQRRISACIPNWTAVFSALLYEYSVTKTSIFSSR